MRAAKVLQFVGKKNQSFILLSLIDFLISAQLTVDSVLYQTALSFNSALYRTALSFDSALYRTALSVTQQCTEQRSA